MSLTETKERPILFSGPMVRAILDGSKTQTRRVVKNSYFDLVDGYDRVDSGYWRSWVDPGSGALASHDVKCPYGVEGHLLWVRETWADVNSESGPSIMYRADNDMRTWQDFSTSFGPDYGAGPSMDYDSYPGDYTMWWSDLMNGEPDHKWKPSIHMYRWASRITLEINSIGIERLNDISHDDCLSEGVSGSRRTKEDGQQLLPAGNSMARQRFCNLWESINGEGSWSLNPWVWVVKFHRVES